MVGNDGDGNSGEEFLPYDVMINILKRVPVKSLTQFKCVAKDWAKLLKTPYFTAQHLHHSAYNNPFLLLQRIPRLYHDSRPFTSSSCLIGPDFKVHDPQFIDFTSPAARIVCSCNGLLCVRHTDRTELSLWNPATRQVRQVPGTLIDIKNFYHIGFGFSPVINDYKIIRISVSEFNDEDQIVVLDNIRVNRAEVYSLTAGSWKEIDAISLQTLHLMSNSVTADGAVFWQATMNSDSESDPDPEFVVSFDIGQEVFTLLKGPPPPASPTHSYSNILAAYKNKLAMFHHFIMGNFESSSIDLWVLENTHTCAAGESWIKNYSVGPFSRVLYPLSIWRDEIVCREELPRHIDEYSGVETVLSLFNPYSNELKNLPAHRDEYYYVSFNYAESLVPIGNIHCEQ